VILKSYIIEQNISLLEKHKFLLMYGENEGLKDDVKKQILGKNKDAEIINLFQDEIIKSDSLLFKSLNNNSLFNEKKIFFLYEVSDKIFSIVEEVIKNNNEGVQIYIFAGLLDKKSKLRNLFEKNQKLAVIPCYQDNERSLSIYIKNNLYNYKGITQEVTNIIINNSNLDRRVIKNEIIKIKDFFSEKVINKKELEDLLNIRISNNFGEIRDASLLGKKEKVNQLLNETDFLPEDVFNYLYQMNIRINKLLEVKSINISMRNEELALESLKPKVFWKDKPIYIEQLKKWDEEKLGRALTRISELEILMKKNSVIRKDVLIKNLLIGLCKDSYQTTLEA
jgi:DNA polymerase-3 subunit delta